MNKENLRLQMQETQARITYWSTLINSGAYKQRPLEQAVGYTPENGLSWRDCTDEEKLQSSMSSLHARVNRLAEQVEWLMESDEPPAPDYYYFDNYKKATAR